VSSLYSYLFANSPHSLQLHKLEKKYLPQIQLLAHCIQISQSFIRIPQELANYFWQFSLDSSESFN